MGKSHRDNARARKKIGAVAYRKKAKRRKKQYVGSWRVIFTCGSDEIISFAGSNEIRERAQKNHQCGMKDCKPERFERLEEQ